MNAVSGIRYRPDPYIDWELQLFKESRSKDRWCSIMVEIAGEDLDEKKKNLIKLKELVDTKRFLRMTADEYALLVKTIGKLDSVRHEADLRVIWFLYSTEGKIYADPAPDGCVAYREGEFPFKIKYAGPPIESISSDKITSVDVEDVTRCAVQDAGSPKVITAIIDDGIAFANDRFLRQEPSARNTDGKKCPLVTRVAAVWYQDLETLDSDNGMVLGKRLHSKQLDEVDKLIQKGEDDYTIYRKMGVMDFSRPGHQSLAYRLAHGTHVMDLACGLEPDGCAASAVDGKPDLETPALEGKDWPILAVQLPTQVTADTSGQMLTSYVLQAVRTIMLWADTIGEDIPLVINFSYGFSAGPKDGTLILEREIARMVKERKAETVVVLPSGNSYLDRTTAKFGLEPGKSADVGWAIPLDDQTDNFIEVWVDNDSWDGSPLRVTLTSPDGDSLSSADLIDGGVNVMQRDDRTIAAIYYDRPLDKDGKKRHRYFLAVSRTKDLEREAQTAPAGEWVIAFQNCRASAVTQFWAHIQRDDTPLPYKVRGRQSYFDHEGAYNRNVRTGDHLDLGDNCPIKHEGTINAIATGGETIVVGGVLGDVIDSVLWPPAEYSSRSMPELADKPLTSAFSEEGHATPGILASGSRSSSFATMNGTSVAAPQVARLLATLLAEGKTVASAIEGIKDGQPNGRVHKLNEADQRRGHSVVMQPDFDHIPRRRYPVA